MQTRTKSYRVAVIITLLLFVSLTLVLASCDTGGTDNDPINRIIFDPSEDSSVDTSSETASTPEGYTETPVVEDIKNITPDTVVIAGTCEDNATVTIGGGKNDVTVKSRNGYFVTEVILTNTTVTLLEATAEVDGKEPSEPLSFTASYNATAEKRIDGYGVSIGPDSLLYFDTFLDNYTGENLLTQTQLRNFKRSVNDRIINIENRASGQDVRLLYVLIPDVTSIYPEVFPADIEKKSNTTRYKQISDALSQTGAGVIDMYDILKDAKENGEYEIFRKNDSHLTEYGGYLVYEQIALSLSANFPEAAPRGLEEFTTKKVETIGGDLVSYLGINKQHYTEEVINLVPDFALNIGLQEDSGFSTVNIGDIKKYKSVKEPYDFSIYNKGEENAVGIRDRVIIRTDREELPSALIYRDDSLFMSMDIIAERFNNAMIGSIGDYTINLTDASRHYSQGKRLVDYIVVIVSESNIESIMS